MPPVVSQSLLMTELGNDFVKAHEASKNVAASQGNTLPDGLKGIAQLRECCIKKIAKGKKDEGKLMFYADGIIQQPVEFGGYTVRGKRTFITEPIYNTPTKTRKTIKDHIEHIYKILKMLGVKVEALAPNLIEGAMAALKNPKNPVYFSFRVWQPPKATEGQYAGKDSMAMQFWDERVTYKPTVNVENVVKDSLPDVPTENMPDLVESPDDEVNGSSHTETAITTTTSAETVVNPEDVDSGDIHSLAQRADKDNDLQSGNRLTEMAKNAGIPDSDIRNAPSWADLVNLIIEVGSKKGTPKVETKPAPVVQATPEVKEFEVGVGDHVQYSPIDLETKKKGIPVQVEVMEFSADGTKVKLRRLDNRKVVYKDVSLDDVEELK